MKKTIAKINGIDIFAEHSEEGVFVPIKPICTALGISFQGQHEKIKEDISLSPTIKIILTVGADDKEREMVCLPLKFIYGWLFSINPGKVLPEAKDSIIKYRDECYNVLYDHFTKSTSRMIRENKEEIELLKEKNKALEEKKEINCRIKEIDSKIAKIHEQRLNPQTSIFD